MRSWLHRIRTWVLLLLRSHLTPRSIGLAVGIGVMIGMLPIYGLHILVCIWLARRLSLNQPLLYAAANISNPFFAPFIVGAEVAVGRWMRTGEFSFALVSMEGPFWEVAARLGIVFLDCLLGSLPLGLGLGVLLGWVTYTAAGRWMARHTAEEGPPVEGAHGEEEDGEPPPDKPGETALFAARRAAV